MALRFDRWLLGAGAALGLAALLFAWNQRTSPPPAGAYAAAPARPAAPAPAGPAAGAAAHAWLETSAPGPAPLATDPPLHEQVERLLASGDPRQAFSAYALIAQCMRFERDHDRKIYDPTVKPSPATHGLPLRGMTDAEKGQATRVCANMTERERQARLDYLALAAKAGVDGAAIGFAFEGPFGDPSALKTRPDDPLVQAWKASANAQLAQAVDGGDIGALAYMAAQTRTGSGLTDKNPALAYRYALAQGLVFADLLGADNVTAKLYAEGSDFMNAIGDGLTPQQRAAALAEARRIADNARARRNGASAAK